MTRKKTKPAPAAPPPPAPPEPAPLVTALQELGDLLDDAAYAVTGVATAAESDPVDVSDELLADVRRLCQDAEALIERLRIARGDKPAAAEETR